MCAKIVDAVSASTNVVGKGKRAFSVYAVIPGSLQRSLAEQEEDIMKQRSIATTKLAMAFVALLMLSGFSSASHAGERGHGGGRPGGNGMHGGAHAKARSTQPRITTFHANGFNGTRAYGRGYGMNRGNGYGYGGGYGYGYGGGYGGYGLGIGGGYYTGGLIQAYMDDKLPVPPYFSIHPPVYYRAPVPRTYGYSPFAYPGRVRTPDLPAEAFSQPAVINNPHCAGVEGAQSAPSSTEDDVAAATPKMIINPYVTSQPVTKIHLAVEKKQK